jgi:hypothetical protein
MNTAPDPCKWNPAPVDWILGSMLALSVVIFIGLLLGLIL